MTINNNKGMYIEQLVDRTIQYYVQNNLGILEKRQIPIKILKHINETTIVAKLTAKAKVDYFGFINNKYVEIECKQTIHDYFDLLLIKHHQLSYLNHNSQLDNCVSLVLIYFERFDKVVGISYQNLMKCKIDVKKNALPFSKVVEHGKIIDIIYPGILNLKNLFS